MYIVSDKKLFDDCDDLAKDLYFQWDCNAAIGLCYTVLLSQIFIISWTFLISTEAGLQAATIKWKRRR